MAMFAQPKKKSFNWGNALVAAFAPDVWEKKQQAQLEAQQYQQRRQDGLVDYEAKQKIEQRYAAPPQPTQTDRYLQEWLNPGTDPRRKAAIGAILFPPVMGEVNGRLSMIDRTPKDNGPPADAIAELQKDPSAAAEFDEVFGPGSAARYLNGGQSVAPTGGFPGFAPIPRSNGSVYRRY